MQHISCTLMTVVKVLESAVKSTFKKLTQYCRILLCLLGLLYFALAALRRVCVCVCDMCVYLRVCVGVHVSV